jgi:hypothetical protein
MTSARYWRRQRGCAPRWPGCRSCSVRAASIRATIRAIRNLRLRHPWSLVPPAAVCAGGTWQCRSTLRRDGSLVSVPPSRTSGTAHYSWAPWHARQRRMTCDEIRSELATTLAQNCDDPAHPGQSVERGLAWGKTVAGDILAWRATDGFTAVLPPYVAGTAPSDWQPTPPLFGPPLLRQFASMAPFGLTSPSQFLPPGRHRGPPPATPPTLLRSRRWAALLGACPVDHGTGLVAGSGSRWRRHRLGILLLSLSCRSWKWQARDPGG